MAYTGHQTVPARSTDPMLPTKHIRKRIHIYSTKLSFSVIQNFIAKRKSKRSKFNGGSVQLLQFVLLNNHIICGPSSVLYQLLCLLKTPIVYDTVKIFQLGNAVI